MGQAEQMQEFLLVLAVGTSEEFGVSAYDSTSSLEHDLKGTQEISVPVLADVRPVLELYRLITHREGPDSDPSFLIQLDIHPHPLIKVLRGVHKVVEHVVGQRSYLVVGCHVNRFFVGFPDPHMVEGDSQGTDADLLHLSQVHRRLGKDTSVNPLVESPPCA